MDERILARVSASAGRRWFGIMSLVVLGGLLLSVSLSTPPALIWQLFLLALSLAAFLMALGMYRGTQTALELTEEALCDTNGEVLFHVSDIAKVERGTFAMKPSNGFVVITKGPQAFRWRPGLWWRFGRRVAIGGVTPGHQTKPMADILSTMVARAEGQL